MEPKSKKTLLIVLVVMVFVVITGSICCCGGIFTGVKSSMESSGAYTQSLEAVQQDTRVQDALGAPIERDGFMITGSINATPNAGSAQMNYSIKGSSGKTAQVSVHATRSFETWTFQAIDVQLEEGKPPLSVTPLLPSN